ncbi:hypothetical protein [Sinorhizobium chiapasense]|uniref:Transmembrane protein n=1 Tax=Sinorhizobium chiapasense TaxID=501572 RepID=A0ABZ2BE42_9HYPH
MDTPHSTDAYSRAPSLPFADRLPPWQRGRRGLIMLGALVLGLGAVLNWSWLTAAGAAPLLLSIAACVAMCALGLCMNRMMGSPNSASSTVPPESDATTGALDMPRSCCSSRQCDETTAVHR